MDLALPVHRCCPLEGEARQRFGGGLVITLKLFATLTDYLPPASKYTNEVTINLAEGSTIGDVIAAYALPPKWVHLVLVNGVYIDPAKRADHVLKDNDVLAIWPPIAGG